MRCCDVVLSMTPPVSFLFFVMIDGALQSTELQRCGTLFGKNYLAFKVVALVV